MPRISEAKIIASFVGGRCVAILLALRRRRVREHPVRGVHDDLGQLRHHEVHDLGHHAEARRDALRPADDRVGNHVGRFFRRDDRRHVLVDLGRRDHRRAHQRHVDDRELHALVVELGRGAARERFERGLGRDVGREPRRIRQHADRGDVDDVTRSCAPSSTAAGSASAARRRNSSAAWCVQNRGSGRTTGPVSDGSSGRRC
jgi:hypothetical protein